MRCLLVTNDKKVHVTIIVGQLCTQKVKASTTNGWCWEKVCGSVIISMAETCNRSILKHEVFVHNYSWNRRRQKEPRLQTRLHTYVIVYIVEAY